jgi:hypothetical protein
MSASNAKPLSVPMNENEALVILESAGDLNAAASADVRAARSIPMLDVIVLAIAFAFFALSVGYTIACDRL